MHSNTSIPPQLLLDFCHLLRPASQLILTLYHHHLVLLRYTGSLGLSDFPPPPFSYLSYVSPRIVARLFSLVLWLHAHLSSSVNVVRCTCRFIHKRYSFLSPVPLRFPVRMWAGRFWVHDVRARYDVPHGTDFLVQTSSAICVQLMIPYRPDVLKTWNGMIS